MTKEGFVSYFTLFEFQYFFLMTDILYCLDDHVQHSCAHFKN